MQVIVGFISAWTVAYALLAAYFTALAQRDRSNRDLRLFAIFCGLQGLTTLTSAMHQSLVTQTHVQWLTAARMMAVLSAGTVYFLLLMRLARGAALAAKWQRIVVPVSVGFLVAVPLGVLIRPLTISRVVIRWTPTGEQSGMFVGAHPVVSTAMLWALILSLSASFTMIRAAWRGERVLRAAYLGSALVSLSTLWDVFAWTVHLGLPTTAEHALFLFTFTVSYALTARIADEAHRRRDELRQLNETLHTLRVTLEHKEQLAAVGELSAVLAHEVRNPISVICNAVANLRRPEISASDRALLHSILDEESHRLNRIVTNMLQLARPLVAEWRRVDARAVLDRVIETARTGNTEVVVEIHPGLQAEIFTDGDLLRQAVQNVVDNAIQAMRNGGTLTVRLTPSIRAEHPGYEFTVIDTGEGMNTEVRSRARDAFFTTRASGTGLGLAIVDRIVHAMEGELVIESARDLGTTVRIWIPQREERRPTPTPVPMRLVASQ